MKKHGSGQFSTHGYKVEVRTSYHQPTIVGDFVIDNTWRVLPVREIRPLMEANSLVACAELDRDMLRHASLLSYHSAEAHRWALLAGLEAATLAGSLCIETRLVGVDFTYTYQTEEVGVTETLRAERGMRNHMKPRDEPPAKEPEAS